MELFQRLKPDTTKVKTSNSPSGFGPLQQAATLALLNTGFAVAKGMYYAYRQETQVPPTETQEGQDLS